jgi:hypothetical protein
MTAWYPLSAVHGLAAGSRLTGPVIAGSGHNMALGNPPALAKAYLDFFAGL